MLFKEDRTAFKRRYSIQEILFDILKCIDGVPSLKEMFRMLKKSAALCDSWNSPMLLQWNDLHDVPLVSISFLHMLKICAKNNIALLFKICCALWRCWNDAILTLVYLFSNMFCTCWRTSLKKNYYCIRFEDRYAQVKSDFAQRNVVLSKKKIA